MHAPSRAARLTTLPCGKNVPLAGRSDLPRDPKSGSSTLKLASLINQLDAFVRSQNLKQSKQRTRLVEFILETPGHFGIQDLVQKVQTRFPEMGAATVYRNVKTLCDAGILRETLLDADNRVVYELNLTDHHDHIVCLDCNHIFEFHDEEIERRQDETARALGFTAVRHRHVVYGRCERLEKKSIASPKKDHTRRKRPRH